MTRKKFSSKTTKVRLRQRRHLNQAWDWDANACARVCVCVCTRGRSRTFVEPRERIGVHKGTLARVWRRWRSDTGEEKSWLLSAIRAINICIMSPSPCPRLYWRHFFFFSPFFSSSTNVKVIGFEVIFKSSRVSHDSGGALYSDFNVLLIYIRAGWVGGLLIERGQRQFVTFRFIQGLPSCFLQLPRTPGLWVNE